MALLEMPFLDLAPSSEEEGSLRLAAQTNLKNEQWARAEDVHRLDIWRAHVHASDDPFHQQWCWISTTQHAPAWEHLSIGKLKEWMPLWLHFLQLPEVAWISARQKEKSRPEADWIHGVRQMVPSSNAAPLHRLWDHHEYPPNVFWKAAVVAFSTIPKVANSLLTPWLNELKLHRTDPSLLFLWVPMAAMASPTVPSEFSSWLHTLMRDDPPTARLLQLRQGCTTSLWLDAIYLNSITGTLAQRHTPPQPAVHTNLQTIWNSIQECSYETRLQVTAALLSQPDLDSSVSRWPLNFQAMTRTIQNAAPHLDIRVWGTAPWLAGVLHVLPEFAKVLVFHDLLPVTPAQVHQLVLLYQNNQELSDSAELFANLDIDTP